MKKGKVYNWQIKIKACYRSNNARSLIMLLEELTMWINKLRDEVWWSNWDGISKCVKWCQTMDKVTKSGQCRIEKLKDEVYEARQMKYRHK